jgi:hypothetical protein
MFAAHKTNKQPRLRTLFLSMILGFSAVAGVSLTLARPASASCDLDLAARLETSKQYLMSQKRNLDRDLDETTYMICRLQRSADSDSVARALDGLYRAKRDQEFKEQDVLMQIRCVEDALRNIR